ncbi:hypothetical protein D6C93_08012 [Aureobasidium pullulans]|nr:hypothetical protein D6C93_08012 [Aureobasidium pullulans]
MTTNPNLLFALQSIIDSSPPSPTLNTSSPPKTRTSRKPPRLRDLLHGCVNGTKITTCKVCIGRVLRDDKKCAGCKGTGFAMNKCGACHAGAITLAVLIEENAADVLAGDVIRAEQLAEEMAKQTTIRRAHDEG